MESISLQPIGVVRSCFKEKFGTPRQPGLVPSAKAVLEIAAPYNQIDAFRGLEEFSHVWLVFLFDRSMVDNWKPTVRPPRLGGNKRLGVFATRSNFRPNPVGLSLVKLDHLEATGADVRLHLSGIDLLDGTPVLDIKPYLPYAESIPTAYAGFAEAAPDLSSVVEFSQAAEMELESIDAQREIDLRQLICEVLAHDPRPAYKKADDKKIYGMRLLDLEIQWQKSSHGVVVESIYTKKD